tara:strand:- start:1893 stop:3131 length:1239 start_codon:yes stop_codon:yes gene_type:complete
MEGLSCDILLATGEIQNMATFRAFILRFLIILLPTLLIAFALFKFQTLTKLELSLMSLLSLGLPWLFYELLQHHNHQTKATRALLSFCTSMERILMGMTSLEKTTKEAPKEMIAELRMMQTIMEQIVHEKEPKEKTADVIDINQTQKAPQKGDSQPRVVEENSTPLTRIRLLEIIEKALNSDRIEMLVQPIVSLPQRKARHFECFSRIREEDGTIYTPDHFVHLAEEENLIRLVDNAMLFRCIQLARPSVKKNFDVNFFCNISQHTLSDKFFFDSLSEFLHSNRELAQHMVFEFHENAIEKHLGDIEPYLKKLNLYDCRFSIDQVTNLDLDIKRLKNLNFKYIKFHSNVLIKALGIDSGHKQVQDFKKTCDLNHIDVIISHIENEQALLKLNDFHFDYGQGFLFGSPVLSKR